MTDGAERSLLDRSGIPKSRSGAAPMPGRGTPWLLSIVPVRSAALPESAGRPLTPLESLREPAEGPAGAAEEFAGSGPPPAPSLTHAAESGPAAVPAADAAPEPALPVGVARIQSPVEPSRAAYDAAPPIENVFRFEVNATPAPEPETKAAPAPEAPFEKRLPSQRSVAPRPLPEAAPKAAKNPERTTDVRIQPRSAEPRASVVGPPAAIPVAKPEVPPGHPLIRREVRLIPQPVTVRAKPAAPQAERPRETPIPEPGNIAAIPAPPLAMPAAAMEEPPVAPTPARSRLPEAVSRPAPRPAILDALRDRRRNTRPVRQVQIGTVHVTVKAPPRPVPAAPPGMIHPEPRPIPPPPVIRASVWDAWRVDME